MKTSNKRNQRNQRNQKKIPPTATTFLRPRELAERWACSRSSADRIARGAGFTRMCLSDGENGIVRYKLEEVIRYENERMVTMRDN